ncbi:hypothetical protein BN2476_480011 [Paraburkholderia piptadeniae]|uniref:Uncharacterized protein n=1 Tax=Paraburkholderia piptadeniae TaxID=1701573 RepID=A0A1N7SEL7_9BURK|nr:hypothetical protein [Paraburkholderia piptadeniae]SIT45782.1 hypothetical protein BN2476_480011 [Paraburkholderia piptadeniae]
MRIVTTIERDVTRGKPARGPAPHGPVAQAEYTRERVPLTWAMTQNKLGLALTSLGEREIGTARLEMIVSHRLRGRSFCARREHLHAWPRLRGLRGARSAKAVIGSALSVIGSE